MLLFKPHPRFRATSTTCPLPLSRGPYSRAAAAAPLTRQRSIQSLTEGAESDQGPSGPTSSANAARSRRAPRVSAPVPPVPRSSRRARTPHNVGNGLTRWGLLIAAPCHCAAPVIGAWVLQATLHRADRAPAGPTAVLRVCPRSRRPRAGQRALLPSIAPALADGRRLIGLGQL